MLLVFKVVVATAAAAYAVAAGVMYIAQRQFIYFPDPARTSPSAADLPDVSERILSTPDGERIVAWYAPAKPGQPTILYFHGNGGALELRRETIRRYLDRGRGMFMMAYRGYSGSTGSPSEAANVADAKLAYDSLVADGVNPEDIILYGESLGSGVAIQVAREKRVGGMVLDSPYTSILELASQHYPWLPVAWLLKDRYDSIGYIAGVHVPLFILHGEADNVVPVEMGKRLFAAANEPKEIRTIPGGGHVIHDGPTFALVDDWITRLRASRLHSAN
ncbi:alpha/beta hydrolase [Hyphomicrobium sp.]|uniref:alpha/beta hydrolase n=1 Tax=Hyphomicrobium sp. TaxID=82 RepID=UPI002D77165E|nr:alpha/beta hydrolase [Hyphomicrobium sp.]HET6390258.1 alpha/beta hydrolase [Hyphomicrobium sp.]